MPGDEARLMHNSERAPGDEARLMHNSERAPGGEARLMHHTIPPVSAWGRG